MKYTSVNEPDKFVFHDGYLDKISFIGSDMLWNVSDICVEKNSSQNNGEFAMGIDNAEVAFKNYRIESAVVEGVEMSREQWEETVFYCGESQSYFSGWSSVISENGVTITAEFIFENSVVSMKIFCTEFTVSWDNFNGRAWYDRDKKDGLLKRIVKKITAKNEG